MYRWTYLNKKSWPVLRHRLSMTIVLYACMCTELQFFGRTTEFFSFFFFSFNPLSTREKGSPIFRFQYYPFIIVPCARLPSTRNFVGEKETIKYKYELRNKYYSRAVYLLFTIRITSRVHVTYTCRFAHIK